VKGTKADKELAGARGITARVGRRAGLFVLFDEDRRGLLWTYFAAGSGQSLMTWRPRSGFWTTPHDGGREKDWRDVLRMALRRLRRVREGATA
jgi:hypothetical protein